MTRLGILGGTFDPIHVAHLDVARAAADALDFDHVRLVPAAVPPHRPQPGTSPFHRFAMVALCAALDSRFVADDVELMRAGPSYTADTLRGLQQQGWGARQLFFLTGTDAFAEIALWREYPALLNLANFVVCSRPGRPAALVRGLLPALADRMVEAPAFSPDVAPAIVLLDAATRDVSSTGIRTALAQRQTTREMLPPTVETYIRRHGLYNAEEAATTH